MRVRRWVEEEAVGRARLVASGSLGEPKEETVARTILLVASMLAVAVVGWAALAAVAATNNNGSKVAWQAPPDPAIWQLHVVTR